MRKILIPITFFTMAILYFVGSTSTYAGATCERDCNAKYAGDSQKIEDYKKVYCWWQNW